LNQSARGISDIGVLATKSMRQRRDPKIHNSVKGDDDDAAALEICKTSRATVKARGASLKVRLDFHTMN
jgi:hypothetical protein